MANDSPGSGEQSFRLRWTLAVRDDFRLRPVAKLVAWTLSSHMDANGGSCFPGIPRLAIETGLCENTVRAAVRELEERQYVAVNRGGGRRRGGSARTNEYQALLPANPSRDAVHAPHDVRSNPSRSEPELVTELVSPVSCGDDVSPPPRRLDPDAEEALLDLLSEIDDRDANSERTLRRHFSELSADDFYYAAEVLAKRRNGTRLVDEPIESEARFVFAVLSNLECLRRAGA
jgi:DNA-binding transcriptional MocR family regulator